MAKSTRIGLILAVLLLVIGGVLYLGRPEVKTPDQLITESLADAGTAAQRGDVGGVMDAFSDHFHAGDWNKPRLRLLLSRTLSAGRGTPYDVHINVPKILPSPTGKSDEREVITRFSAFYPGGEDIYKSNDAVELIMRAETRRRYLLFREPHWRIVSIINLPSLPGSNGDDLGM